MILFIRYGAIWIISSKHIDMPGVIAYPSLDYVIMVFRQVFELLDVNIIGHKLPFKDNVYDTSDSGK